MTKLKKKRIITYLSSTYENFIFNECFDRNVFESNGTSMFDGCGIKRAIPMNWWWFFASSNTMWPSMLMTWNCRNRFCFYCRKSTKTEIAITYLVGCTLDINAATTACQCALNTNHSTAIRWFEIFLLVFSVCLQNIAQFIMIALMGIVPNRISNDLNL